MGACGERPVVNYCCRRQLSVSLPTQTFAIFCNIVALETAAAFSEISQVRKSRGRPANLSHLNLAGNLDTFAFHTT